MQIYIKYSMIQKNNTKDTPGIDDEIIKKHKEYGYMEISKYTDISTK